jgi:hypothetical protein
MELIDIPPGDGSAIIFYLNLFIVYIDSSGRPSAVTRAVTAHRPN